MKSLLILPLLLAVSAQVKCGVLHRGVSSSFTPSISSRQYSRGFRSGSDITSLGDYGLGGDGLSGGRSFGSSRFSSEAGLRPAGRTGGVVTGGFGYGNTEAEFRNAAGVGNDLGSRALYSQQTETVNVPRPVSVPRPFPIEASTPVRADVPRSYPIEVARPYSDSVSQPLDVNVPLPLNVQSGIGSLSGTFGWDSGRGIGLGSGTGLGLARGFGEGSRIIGRIESGIRNGDLSGAAGVSSGYGYSDASTSGWTPKWSYNGNGGYRY